MTEGYCLERRLDARLVTHGFEKSLKYHVRSISTRTVSLHLPN